MVCAPLAGIDIPAVPVVGNVLKCPNRSNRGEQSPVTPSTAPDSLVDIEVTACERVEFGIPDEPRDERGQDVIEAINVESNREEPVVLTSRLSLCRNRASRQRAACRMPPPEDTLVEVDACRDEAASLTGNDCHDDVTIIPVSVGRECRQPKECIEIVDSVPIFVSDSSARVVSLKRPRPRTSSPDSLPGAAEPSPTGGSLHPFFRATSSAVANAKDRPKRPRNNLSQRDSWVFPASTIHVNCKQPIYPYDAVRSANRPVPLSLPSPPCRASWKFPPRHPSFNAVDGQAFQHGFVSEKVWRPAVAANVDTADTELWSERYRNYERLDVMSAGATKELVDWMRGWYDPGTRRNRVSNGRNSSDCSSSDDSGDEFAHALLGDKFTETIAVLTGPVGCGKSTVVAIAARKLGLSILEINASVCRTGKRVRDIVGEALRSHRVSLRRRTSSVASAGGVPSDVVCNEDVDAKTLILFEEVDEIHDDERGFWAGVQDLATSSESRRPIICTANRFSPQMQLVLGEQKTSIETEVNLLVTGAVPQADRCASPVPFKHIVVPERSLRQVSAVLKRIAISEKLVIDEHELNAITSHNRGGDIRQAINMLQFWASPGLDQQTVSRSVTRAVALAVFAADNEKAQLLCGPILAQEAHVFGMNAPDSMPLCPSMFRVASDLVSDELSKDDVLLSRVGQKETCRVRPNTDELLARWADALDGFCIADVVSSAHNYPECHFDSDRGNEEQGFAGKLGCFEVTSELDAFSFQSAQDTLHSAASKAEAELQILRQSSSNYKGCICDNGLPSMPANLASPMRSVQTEYLPYLRSMAVSEAELRDKSKKDNSNAVVPVSHTRRRTRSAVTWSHLDRLGISSQTLAVLRQNALSSY